jgi:hypothetical protein
VANDDPPHDKGMPDSDPANPEQGKDARDRTMDWGAMVRMDDPGTPSLHINQRRPAAAGPSAVYAWRPPPDLRPEIPEGYPLALRCHVGEDGLRRFSLIATRMGPKGASRKGRFIDHIAVMMAGGLAILDRLKGLGGEGRSSYRMMGFILQYARRMRAYRRRSFNCPKDLLIASPAGSTEGTVIDWIAPQANRPGRAGDLVNHLISEGRDAARGAGITRPTTSECIHHGLAAHARSDTARLAVEQVPGLIRAALFESDAAAGSVGPGVQERVAERFSLAFHGHLGDETEEFNRWFLGRNSSIITQLCRAKDGRGGDLRRDLVGGAMLQLGWEAHRYVGDCISLMMQAVARSLPDPLDDREDRIFRQMHLPQPHFGGLPLIMLGDRFEFLEGALQDYIEDPDSPDHTATVHTLLQFYILMSSRRREADREIKRPRSVTFVEQVDSPRRSRSDRFTRIAAHILEERGLGCGCSSPQWDAKLNGEPGDVVRFSCVCLNGGCDAAHEVTLARGEFAAFAAEVIE